jgi:hypothetical protein
MPTHRDHPWLHDQQARLAREQAASGKLHRFERTLNDRHPDLMKARQAQAIDSARAAISRPPPATP